MISKLLEFIKITKAISVFVFDIVLINVSFIAAMFLYAPTRMSGQYLLEYLLVFITITIIKVAINIIFSLYSSLWEYASIEELIRVLCSVTLSNLFSAIFVLLLDQSFYFGILIVTYAFDLVLIGGNRFIYRIARRLKNHNSILHQYDNKRIILVGSGSTSSLIATEIKTHPDRYGRLIGFIDDDKSKIGKYLGGVKILGGRNDIVKIVMKYKINEIILAIPTATRQDTKQILEICKLTNSKVTIVPGIVEIIDGQVSMEKIRSINIEDLLGREAVDLCVEEISFYLEDKIVMVTGGGGSIGSEICRQIIRFKPAKLVVLDIYENNIYNLQFELAANNELKTHVEVLIASVRERDTIFNLIEKYKPDVVFHAAAHKHVPLMESSPKEAIKNNVLGTLNIAEAAHQFSVNRFVLISSDKAVNPSSIMGASKRLCEMIVQSLAQISSTKFVAVRFGNVLGSNGSVIPLFEKQIKDGGPVTITHKDIVRFFMTITEAAQLVIQAGAIAEGGEIFVLDMGKPVKIYDLALDLIKLSGLKPHDDIDIVFTKLRPGEKLFEELYTKEEELKNSKYDKIRIVSPPYIDFNRLKSKLTKLESTIKKCMDEDIGELLIKLVPDYKPQNTNLAEQMIDIVTHNRVWS